MILSLRIEEGYWILRSEFSGYKLLEVFQTLDIFRQKWDQIYFFVSGFLKI